MVQGLTIELLAGSADDCAAAARLGADRVELNSSLGAGGLTPSPGSVKLGAERSGLPVIAMLRPRPAGFCYEEAEFETMRRDAAALAAAGASGFAFGVLYPDGRVDEERCAALMAEAPELEWVFHRAFDLVPSIGDALETLVRLGVRRVLTKGQANSFEDGEANLLKLRDLAQGRIELLVPGIRPHNVARVVGADRFDQIHLGRFVDRADPSSSARPEIYFGASAEGRSDSYPVLDEAYGAQMIAAARAAAGAAR